MQDAVLHANKLTSPSKILEKDREVVIPINCSCSGSFFQANASYLIPEDTKKPIKISCEVLFILALAGLGFYYKTSYKWRENKLHSLSTRSSTTSCLSPDLVAEMSKYSLIGYSFNELRQATRAFSEDTKLGSSVYKGSLGGTEVVIKRMGSGDARRTVSIYSKINHINIIKLEGVCYGESDFSSSYLVFEFTKNGCLRDCLRKPVDVLPWHRRTQIAFDVAVGLHCTVPSYIHMNITSRSILITEDWRAKIANLGVGSVINSSKGRGDVMVTSEGWIVLGIKH